jgi:hypothetical protein
MLNKDTAQVKKAELLTSLTAALKEGDEEKMAKAFADYAEMVQNSVIQEAVGITELTDQTVLASRGLRQLTEKETKYYENLIKSMKAAAVQKDFTGLDSDGVLPETVIESVFDDIRQNHPLLSAIQFVNTSAAVKFVVNKQGPQAAVWGALNSAITEELSGAVAVKDMTLCKLTAWMPLSLDMLDLGPVWVDRYVREVLSESVAAGLESAIVDGDGNNKPIGMTRDVSSRAVTRGGEYQQKSATAITDLSPTTFGVITAKMAAAPNGGTRVVDHVILLVNPVDYLQKVMPCTTVQAADGTYRTGIFPFPTTVIQSAAVPSNKAIMGLGNRYFMGLGVGGSGGKIEYSDEFKFLEDVRTYKIKLYGNGEPLDNTAFQYLDISKLEPVNLKVEVKGTVTTKAEA